ncbi:hypothetical protein K3495_g3032 [Podosphaera aphanis]|nr:hypothetical protein K3495_g3032 [Podosphaera aphanis]
MEDKKKIDEQDRSEVRRLSFDKPAWLLNNPKDSDVTIRIAGVDIYAHQSVICTQSEYFKKAFGRGSRGFAEASTKTIEFKEGSSAAYWRVLEYLYTGDYSYQLSTKEFLDDPMLLKDIRVYELADMFLLERLKTLAEAKLEKKLQISQLNTSFTTCVREVYAKIYNPSSKMRNSVVNAAVGLVEKLKFVEKWHNTLGGLDSSLASHELILFKNLLQEGGCFVGDYFMASNGLITSRKE